MYVKGEVLDGDNKVECEEYNNKKINVLKRTSIKSLSNVLIVHLKRFEYDVSTWTKKKLNDYFEFPMRINFSEWMHESVQKRDTRGFVKYKDTQFEDINTNPDENYIYDLSGVVVHCGSLEGGHYYSLIKDRVTSLYSIYLDGKSLMTRK